jgi:acetyltransferase-like isoleucine patch superfamily enzyme
MKNTLSLNKNQLIQMEGFINYTGDKSRPHNSKFQNLLFNLLKVPYLQQFIIPLLVKSYKLPVNTSINLNFKCTAPLLNLAQNVCLADTFIVAWAPIYIGKNTTFSYGNSIINSTHDFEDFYTVIGKTVIIGENTWVTSNCTILGGVKIGNNTVIGAGSVVVNDIPSGVFAAGNPCKVIKNISFRIND